MLTRFPFLLLFDKRALVAAEMIPPSSFFFSMNSLMYLVVASEIFSAVWNPIRH
jgi:hypothetical protein